MIKRLIISAVLFCLVLIFGIFGNVSANKAYNYFCEQIDIIEAGYLNGDDVSEHAKNLESKWAKSEKLLTAFQNRETVDDLGRSFARLTPYAVTKSDADFLCECSLIRLRLLEVKQSMGLSAESLL